MAIRYRILGEQFLDFVVYTRPLITVIRVMGSYWHNKTKYEDALKASKIKRYYKGQVKILDIKDTDIPTVDETVKLLRRELIL